MNDYIIYKVNLHQFSDKVYVIRKKGKFEVYNYNHEFINESKVIKNGGYVRLNQDYLYFWNPYSRIINRWNYITNEYDKIKFTNHLKPYIEKIVFNNQYTIIYYKFSEESSKYSFENKGNLVFINDNKIEHEVNIMCQSLNNYVRQLISHNNQLYILNQLDYVDEKYTLSKWENNMMINMHTIHENGERNYQISNDGKYSMLVTMDEHNNGRIHVYDFHTFEEIDRIDFYQDPFYTTISYFMEYDHDNYIVFQDSPEAKDEDQWQTDIYSIDEHKIIKTFKGRLDKDALPEYNNSHYIIGQIPPFQAKKEVWHTHIYSIKEKRIMKSFSESIGIESLPGKRMLIIQTLKNRKVIFHKY